ncbi:MAG: phage major capsid protein [Actinomycetes bacterium]|jgi:HK97 family phage major capsid protein|nr:phage major capsid protein [Actinomycetes bacterium]
MKSIGTTNYRAAFIDAMKRRDAVNIEDAALGQTPDGFVLPTAAEAAFKAKQEQYNIFRSLATVQFINADNKLKTLLPAGDAAFVAEGAAIPEATVGLTSWTIDPHKIAQIIKVTNETLRDSGFDLESALAADFGRAFGKVEEDGVINGGGVSEPYGLLHASQGAETGATSAAAGTISADDIRSLYFSLGREYRRNAVWLMSDTTALLLRTLKDTSGAYLWNGADNTLLGKPVYTSPYMPDTASGEKPVLFGDLTYYRLVQRGAATIQPLHERYAESGITGYLGTEFIDGKLVKREAVKALVVA